MHQILLAAALFCPVSSHDLVALQIPYWGLDHQSHQGILVVNKAVEDQIISIFNILYQARFPISKMKPLEDYDNNDQKALEDNDTFAYSCRTMIGHTHKFSIHAYGLAVDINPVFNPYIKNNIILPINGKPYLNRNLDQPGIIHANSIVTDAFEQYGWQWGGDWHSRKDYQHFEQPLTPY